MFPDQQPPPAPPPTVKSAPEIVAHQARLLMHLLEAERLLLSLSVGLFSAADWQETTFLIRQIEAEIDLLNWVLGIQPATWLDDIE